MGLSNKPTLFTVMMELSKEASVIFEIVSEATFST
jgi:hypothetical protein